MIIDFNEIPPANSSHGDQDLFELFARDFVQAIGLKIEEHPGRGQDGGKDLLLVETLRGIRLSATRKWLLSAKHFAPSGRSVGVKVRLTYGIALRGSALMVFWDSTQHSPVQV
jgi:hypothetical protein